MNIEHSISVNKEVQRLFRLLQSTKSQNRLIFYSNIESLLKEKIDHVSVPMYLVVSVLTK